MFVGSLSHTAHPCMVCETKYEERDDGGTGGYSSYRMVAVDMISIYRTRDDP